MFWRVAGFNQPSPIEQILDKEEYTLEELLDEDDIIQECKSLNGRLVSFLREKSTVEQLLRYLVEPQSDTEDPKKQYKYPFTACEVFCCEVEAIFNTLLSQPELMRLLFSLLDQPPPLSCKAAGYFGRVVQHLLLRKTNETMSYLQENKEVLESLINHIDTTSIADIFKRLMGADEQTSAAMMPNHLSWLAETPLIELLLQRFGPEFSPEVQQNAADILTSVAHTQPSPIALKLTKDQSISYLFQHALAPGGRVLVSALDVCIALLEPRRHTALIPMQGEPGYDTGMLPSKKDAVQATLKYIVPLVNLLDAADPEATQETPFGMLRPPLGTARLKIVELLAVLLRAGEELAERAVMDAGAVPKCLDLFVAYPFNNLLHYHITAMLVTGVTSKNSSIIEYLFGTCKVAEWLMNVPEQTTPLPRPGTEAASADRPPLRAGYMGHISCLAQVFHNKVEGEDRDPTVGSFLHNNEAWQQFWDERLAPHLAIENVKAWECGRPDAGNVDMDHSDTEEYQNDMDPELMQGMQSSLYHRYSVGGADDEDEDDDVEMRMDSLDTMDLLAAGGATSTDAMVGGGELSTQGPGGEDRKHAIEEALSGLNISEEEEEGQGAVDVSEAEEGGQGGEAGQGEQQEGEEPKKLWFDQPAADSATGRSLPESHVVDMPLEHDDDDDDDDDQVLYDEDELPAAPTAAPASEPQPSAPVTAPLANGTEVPPDSSGVKAFPLEQLPAALQDDAQTSPTGTAAAAAADSSGAPTEAEQGAGEGAGAGGEADATRSNGKVLNGGKGGQEEQEFNDNMYWKSSYKIEVPDDI